MEYYKECGYDIQDGMAIMPEGGDWDKGPGVQGLQGNHEHLFSVVGEENRQT